MIRRTSLVVALLFCLGSSEAARSETPFAVKAGDLWVMAGDSITAQRQHSNYIEAFFRTRYPELKLRFRNSGIGGNTTSSVANRFDYDVAAHKPTIVSIELGMNDVGSGDDPSKYIAGMKNLLKLIRDTGATPLLISSSPVNDGSKMDDWKGDRGRKIHPYTEALKKLAEEEKVAVVDQFHPLLALWHSNKLPLTGHEPAPPAPKPGEKPKPVFIPEKVTIGGDPVHPGPVGQYTMAAVILKALKVNQDVSSAKLKADGTVVEARSCKITDAAATNGVLKFTRLDERSPWPIHTKYRSALQLLPEMADLSRYLLQVEGLPAGEYTIVTNGKEAAQVSADDLAKGWNMSTVQKGVIAERGDQIVDLVFTLQQVHNNAWRTASKEKNAAALAEAQKGIDAAEAELFEACTPQPIQFEIRPVAK